MSWILRTGYPSTLLAAAASIFAGVVTIMAVNALVASAHGGNREFAEVKRRKAAIEHFIATP
jgi:hypothetical protein